MPTPDYRNVCNRSLEDAGLLSKEKLLAGDIMPTLAEEKNPDDDGPDAGAFHERRLRPEL